jgi:MFS transporter, FSR family, fosmidomycin resistance protein
MAESEPAAVYHAPASAGLLASAAQVVRPNTKLIALLSIGHFVVDLNQGSLPALLPFLKSAHQLSYAAVATIVLAGNVASSIVQPVFGYFADKDARRWMLPASVLLTGAGFALLGLAPGYAAMLALVVAMGLGVAAYHPEAYKTATSVAGERKATALSWFSLGGNVGVALGPPVITALVAVAGLTGSLGLLAPTVIASLLLLMVLPAFSQSAAPRAAAAAAARGVNMPGAMALLILVVTIRSWTTLGFTTFVPFYYIDTLGADPRLVGPLLFVFLGAGAVATVIAGPFADRWGPRAFMQWVLLAALPFGALFLLTRGVLAFVMLAMFGALLTSSFTVSVVLGQAYLPRNAGMASGLIVGFAIGAGGLGVTALGGIADRYGLPVALWISALTPLLAVVATRFLPAPRVQEAR